MVSLESRLIIFLLPLTLALSQSPYTKKMMLFPVSPGGAHFAELIITQGAIPHLHGVAQDKRGHLRSSWSVVTDVIIRRIEQETESDVDNLIKC